MQELVNEREIFNLFKLPPLSCMASTVGKMAKKFLSAILNVHLYDFVNCVSVERRVLSELNRVLIVFNTWVFLVSINLKFF